jgi:uncharacterized protein YcfJ
MATNQRDSGHLACGHADVKALHIVHAHALECVVVGLVFNELGDGQDADLLTQAGEVVNQGVVCFGIQDVTYERAVDFDVLEPQLPQVVKRVVAAVLVSYALQRP